MGFDPLVRNTVYLVQCYGDQRIRHDAARSDCEIRQWSVYLGWLIDEDTDRVNQVLPEIMWTSKAITRRMVVSNLSQLLLSTAFAKGPTG